MHVPIILAAASPDADSVRRVAREVLQRDYYQLTPRRPEGRGLMELLIDFLQWLSEPIKAAFEWLYAISPVFGWLFISLLVLIVVALTAHIIYLMVRATETSVVDRTGTRHAPPADPAQLERMSADAARRADWIAAARYLFHASLARLQVSDERKIRKSATNRELLREYRGSPVRDPLGVLIEVIEHKWYGQGICAETDFASCQAAYANLCRAARSPADA